MDFVATYREWSARTDNTGVGAFFAWVRNHCDVTVGDAMTEDEVQAIADIAGATPLEVDQVLMESAWP